jgi:sigma-B regulation protein RsbU (phosphoserine phosphatase)
MARGIGGDYYHLARLDNGNWLCAVCDVSGKGVSASLVSVLTARHASGLEL